MKTYELNDKNVKLIGRTYPFEGNLWSAFSGTGIEFDFEGEYLAIILLADESCKEEKGENLARYAVLIDGEEKFKGMLDKEKTELVVFDSASKARVQVIKLSECAMSTMGIAPLVTDDNAKVTPAPERSRKIEFIGDSITCGYGVDDEDATHNFKTSTEDCTGAYAYKAARLLDADYSLVSISGYGIISGYTATAESKIPEQTVPQYYKSLGFSYNKFAGKLAPQDIPWDFSRYIPQAVVINLGTNDDSYCLDHADRQRDYTDNYKLFLKEVRANNPDAFIFCTVGIMGTRIYKALETAVNEYKAESEDTKILSYCFTEQDHENDGYAADYHPTRKTHDKASKAISQVIKETMGW
ncbi:MAG: lipase [Ruminococcus sp.]|nr:lipase [Ruminococcus sp.]